MIFHRTSSSFLGSISSLLILPAHSRGWNEINFKVPSNPTILRFCNSMVPFGTPTLSCWLPKIPLYFASHPASKPTAQTAKPLSLRNGRPVHASSVTIRLLQPIKKNNYMEAFHVTENVRTLPCVFLI